MASISLTTLLHISRSGLLAQQFSLDSVANNIANVNTVGFKRSRADFNELLSQALEAPKAGDSRVSGQAAGTTVAAHQRFFDQGRLDFTGQPWDMAIEGTGFFQIQRPDGTIAYTRDGTFKLDAEGRLTNADGYYVYPDITIPPDAEEALVTPTGEVMARRRGESEPQVIGTMTLARFTNPGGLESIGDNLYLPNDASGEALVASAQTDGMGQIIGGALEGSNVDLSREMVDMLSAQRAYTLMARAISNSDQMLSMVSQMRGG